MKMKLKVFLYNVRFDRIQNIFDNNIILKVLLYLRDKIEKIRERKNLQTKENTETTAVNSFSF